MGSPTRWFATALAASLPFVLIPLFPDALYTVVASGPFLVFHNLAELFSVVVSLSIFGLGWFAASRRRDARSLFLSMAFLAVGLIDLMHTLGYTGMPDFLTPNDANKSTLFWLVSRFTTATALLASAFVPHDPPRRWARTALSVGFLLWAAVALVLVVYFPSDLPRAWLPGTGLTVFKKATEALVIGLLVGALVAYAVRARRANDPTAPSFLMAFVFCGFSELAFTAYQSVYDSYNVVGHVYKVVAFVLIYRGLFLSSIAEPYDRLHRSLRDKEALLKELFHRTQNSLQMVRSMLVLQSASDDSEAVRNLVTRTEDRIWAISLVHTNLFASGDLSRIALGPYLRDLVNHLLNERGLQQRIAVEMNTAAEVVLMDTALPLGLILNELVTGSLVRAFPGDRRGTLRIAIDQPTPGTLRLSYTHDGLMRPGPEEHWGLDELSLELVRSLAEDQMRATLSWQNEPSGCTLEFPVDVYRARV